MDKKVTELKKQIDDDEMVISGLRKEKVYYLEQIQRLMAERAILRAMIRGAIQVGP